MALTNMTLAEVEGHIWTIIGEDENRFLGGSFAEAVEHTSRISYAVLIGGCRTLTEYLDWWEGNR